MPNAAPSICRDCNRSSLLGSPYCEAHQNNNRAIEESRERNQRRRDNELKRLYDRAPWRKHTVPFILARDPLCQIGIVCEGHAASTDVDHVIRAEIYIEQHGGDPLAFYDPDNLRGACHSCHSRKTVLEQRGAWQEPTRGAGSAGGLGRAASPTI